MPARIWIRPDILDRPFFREWSQPLEESHYRRAYEIWEHASRKLHSSSSEMDRSDAIMILKRCLNQRLKLIENVYKFRNFLSSGKTQYLQLLERLGLVRPLMLQDLMEIRNKIEHDDKRPPKLKRCLELLDVVWYFLRSTDDIVRIRTDSIQIGLDEEPHWASVSIRMGRTWRLEMSGWLPENSISLVAHPDQIQILTKALHTNERWKKQGQHLDKNDTDLWFSGKVEKLPDKLAFARRYFSVC